MPFPPNATFIDYAYRARPAYLSVNAVSTGREIGDMAIASTTATLTPTAPILNWSDIEFLNVAQQFANAQDVVGVGTWDAETGVIIMRSPLSTSIIGDMVVGASAATINTNGSNGGDAQFENSAAATIPFTPGDPTFYAWWEATVATQPIAAINVIVQIGDVTLEVTAATISATANLIQASALEFITAATLTPTANEAAWEASWNSVSATLTVRALNVDALIGDRFEDAVAASLSLVAPLALGSDSPIAETGIITLSAPQLDFQIDWNAVTASQSVVAQAIAALIGDREETTSALTISVNAINVTAAELEYAIAGTVAITAYDVEYYAYSDITAAILNVNAIDVGEPVDVGVTAYEASAHHLEPGEVDVDLSDWQSWVG